MPLVDYFFKKELFGFTALGKDKFYYTYRGYYLDNGKNKRRFYPLAIYFAKSELVIMYQARDGKTTRLFSLTIAHGDQNQENLTRKIQAYWNMPLLLYDKFEDKSLKVDEKLLVDNELLPMSYFSSWYEFELKFAPKIDEFEECKLFDLELDSEIIKNNKNKKIQINIKCKKQDDTWKIENSSEKSVIVTDNINFRKILLDFIYELEFTNTFNDENFNNLMPILSDNKLFNALWKKCRYLDNLYKLKNKDVSPPRKNTLADKVKEIKNKFLTAFKKNGEDEKSGTEDDNLPKTFLDAEISWLNVCMNSQNKDLFALKNSVFEINEDEVALVSFYAYIGKHKIKRKEFFTKKNSYLINLLLTFYLNRYAFKKVLKVLIHEYYVYMVPVILISIVGLDFIMSFIGDKTHVLGISSLYFPIILFIILLKYNITHNINLFRLLFPRMFLGILLGWSVFWSSSDLWKVALILQPIVIILIDLAILLLILVYVFTEIRARLESDRVKDRRVLGRAVGIISIALTVSLVQGFYVIQFYGKPMLENSEIISKIYPEGCDKELFPIEMLQTKRTILQDQDCKTKPDRNVSLATTYGRENFTNFGNYRSVKIKFPFFIENRSIRYIWSILFSQFITSVLIGVVLQLVWGDRQITDPM